MTRKENKGNYGTISLPMPLIEKVKKKIKGTGMNSVSAFVTFILRQLLSEPESNEIFSKDEEKKIRARLKGLGYI
jgi:metal-responsive CopG/Arc/MetJ family transcriptional regulator